MARRLRRKYNHPNIPLRLDVLELDPQQVQQLQFKSRASQKALLVISLLQENLETDENLKIAKDIRKYKRYYARFVDGN
jgi:hypothetical protein